jgi:hypothetical protein
MAIKYWEDFEWATTATLGWRLDFVGTSIAVASGINGLTGNCLRTPISQGAGDFGIGLPATYSEGLFSAAMFIATGTFAVTPIIGLNSGGTNNITIRLNADGSVSALRNTTVLG